MQTSESIKSLCAALAAFNGDCPEVVFDKENIFLKNKYATLGAILKTIRPVMAKHGLAIVQGLDAEGLTTRIVHTSGEWIQSTAPMITPGDEKGKSAAQVYGSIITYMRRYMVTAALGIVSDDDTDAQQHPKKQPVQQAAKQSDEVLAVRALVVKAFGNYQADDKADVQAELTAIRNSNDVKVWEDHLQKLDKIAYNDYLESKAKK